ncbi:MAG: type II toxin-antitoxin system VapB family antitoxin [Deltaproteobacteria bacterium]|nr:type II toxin-antitoxin system VapB family antitoxin [Deltaproteobacteria bacterium]
MAKANYDLPDETLKEVMKLAKARTKREAIIIAMEEYLRRKKIDRLMEASGKISLKWTKSTLEKYRGES